MLDDQDFSAFHQSKENTFKAVTPLTLVQNFARYKIDPECGSIFNSFDDNTLSNDISKAEVKKVSTLLD